jgi:VWFA-related protein
VLILFSDGDDTISKISAREALQTVVSAGALLYTIDLNAIDSKGRAKNRDDSGSQVLRQMAEATGGRYFCTREQATDALQSALEDLHASYVVTYELPSRAAGFHTLRILPKHNTNLQFHCRNGYFYGTGVP